MTYLSSRIMAGRLSKALYYLRASQSPFSLNPSTSLGQALSIIEECKTQLNKGKL